MEILIVGVSIVGSYMIKQIGMFVRYKNTKRKIRTNFIKSLDNKDKKQFNYYISKLRDFDNKYNTDKLSKYVDRYIKKNEINEYKLRKYIKKQEDFAEIFTDIVKEDNIDLILEDTINKAHIVLEEVDRKRKEILIRKDKLRKLQIKKSSKMDKNKKKRG